VWHGAGPAWGGGGGGGAQATLPPAGPSASPAQAAPGSCGGWRSASPLAVGLASALGPRAASLLAPQRVHCNKELVALCIEATSPGTTFDRRRRAAGPGRRQVGRPQDSHLGPSGAAAVLPGIRAEGGRSVGPAQGPAGRRQEGRIPAGIR
jgi:hypothetical protein